MLKEVEEVLGGDVVVVVLDVVVEVVSMVVGGRPGEKAGPAGGMVEEDDGEQVVVERPKIEEVGIEIAAMGE